MLRQIPHSQSTLTPGKNFVCWHIYIYIYCFATWCCHFLQLPLRHFFLFFTSSSWFLQSSTQSWFIFICNLGSLTIDEMSSDELVEHFRAPKQSTNELKVCYHKMKAVLSTSWTKRNTARRSLCRKFWNVRIDCSFSSDKKGFKDDVYLLRCMEKCKTGRRDVNILNGWILRILSIQKKI